MSADAARAARVAVVSGAASGIGAAIAGRLRRSGWRVAGLDLQTAADVDLAVRLDMTDAAAVAAAVARAEDELGPVEVAVSAAGHYAMAALADVDDEAWSRMLRVHLGGLLHLTRAVLPPMRSRRAGCLVAVGSEIAIGGGDGDSHYAAAKGAVHGFVRALAAEVAPDGVRANVVAPGPTDTPLLAADSPWRDPEYLRTLPARRLVRADEIAETVRFVVEEATFMTGEVVSPNAGAVI
ncbi:SDR family NAD(P)-dependent oxidoreductase [Kineococcus rubinsiae]|uniref:SDR family NAD(P)-dependent oxidoreductase n=1 Tax=Kineococcus rubinsiae TaxID=2609562 RepID=UPI00142FACC4|nr:SDR family oxidoreductase [Kineococcus rubinsiae]NIZ92975.1 SDR family oxidoreductase [Kineococcus rubinsiae]